MKKLFVALTAILSPLLLMAQEAEETLTLSEKVDQAFGNATGWFVNGIFATIPFTEDIQVPWVLIVLVGAAIYFTIYFRIINFRGFFTAINVVRGKYDGLEEHHDAPSISEESVSNVDGDNPDTIRVEKDVAGDGEVSHFQALTAALSATVGLGNIAGVAVAVSIGGPGATFWMIIAGLFGMATKFVECTLGVKYREVDENGRIYGGPMYYLSKGLALKKMAGFGKVLAVVFAIMCVGGSFGGGNMFQVNQAFVQVEAFSQTNVNELESVNEAVGADVLLADKKGTFEVTEIKEGQAYLSSNSSDESLVIPVEDFQQKAKVSPMTDKAAIFGLIMAVLVGIVIIGGIKSIAKVTDKIVPFMVVIYVGAALVILGMHFSDIPAAFGQIFRGAFGWEGVVGGAAGVLIQGFRRAAFSNEAGVGSASIAHSAVKTKNPASEGLVALLEPFIDTVLVCTMTALVLVISNMDGGLFEYGNEISGGVDITSAAFGKSISWFPIVLTGAVVLFAFSTMISWSYYGYQAWTYLFGRKKWLEYLYKGIFCLFVWVGAMAAMGSVINFSDAMIFAMLVPNLIGLIILAPVVSDELKKYKAKIKAMKAAK